MQTSKGMNISDKFAAVCTTADVKDNDEDVKDIVDLVIQEDGYDEDDF